MFIFVNTFSIAVTIYLDLEFQFNYGNGLKEVQDLFYGKDGISNLFNLNNGLETMFSFTIVDIKKLKINVNVSKENLR